MHACISWQKSNAIFFFLNKLILYILVVSKEIRNFDISLNGALLSYAIHVIAWLQYLSAWTVPFELCSNSYGYM